MLTRLRLSILLASVVASVFTTATPVETRLAPRLAPPDPMEAPRPGRLVPPDTSLLFNGTLITNGTLVARNALAPDVKKKKCHTMSLCPEENLGGNCIYWCYPSDRYLFMRDDSDWRQKTKSIRMEKDAQCWLYK